MKPLFPILIFITTCALAQTNAVQMLGISTEPVLSLHLTDAFSEYEIQANDDLLNKDGWVTLTNIPPGDYRGIAVDMPSSLFFRVRCLSNSVPESAAAVNVNGDATDEGTKLPPTVPAS